MQLSREQTVGTPHHARRAWRRAIRFEKAADVLALLHGVFVCVGERRTLSPAVRAAMDR